MAKRTETCAIEGATPSTKPGFIKPQLATLRSKAPKGPQWLHEIKLDGYRVQVHLNKGTKKVFTRTCVACNGTGFPVVMQPAQPGRKIYPLRCEACDGKGKITVGWR
jgi:hypothetical protein